MDQTALVKILITGLLMAGLYYSAFSWLIEKDLPREDYNYAYIIPLVA
jgi:hypothetical protein